MSTVHSNDFWKHRSWCGACANHKFEKCVYNHARITREYFRAPCCGRFVRFLTGKNTCKKCVGYTTRQHLRDVKDNKDADGDTSHGSVDLEPHVFNTTHTLRLDDDQFKSVLNSISQLPNVMGDAVDAVQSHLSALVAPLGDTLVKFVAKVTVTLALIYRVSDDVVAVVLSIVQFLLSLNIDFDVVNTFKEFCLNMYSKLTPHTYGCEEIFSVVGFFLSVLTLGRGPSLDTLLAFYKNVCTVKYFSSTIKSVYDVVKNCILAAIDYVSSTFLGYSYEWTADEPYNYIISWCEEVDALFVKHTKHPWDEDMLALLDDLHDRMSGITNHWRYSKPPVTVQSIFMTHANMVRKMFDEVAILGTRQVPRIEPTFVMLQGDSALGKSLITPMIASELISRCGIVQEGKQYSSYIYNRCVETEFWDGYSNQKVIVYDDFGQLYDSAAKPNLELMEVLRLGNSAPFFPNMARLEMKGRTRISCDFVLMSCNVAPSSSTVQSLQHPNAVMRRIDFMIKVDVKEEYKKDGLIMYDKIRSDHIAGKCGCPLPSYSDICVIHYAFTVNTWSGSGWLATETNVSYEHIIDIIAKAHNSRRAMSANRIQAINSRLKVVEPLVSSAVDLDPHSGGDSFPIPYDICSFDDLRCAKRQALDVCEYRDWLERTALVDFAHLYNAPHTDDEDVLMDLTASSLSDELRYLNGYESNWDAMGYTYRRSHHWEKFTIDFKKDTVGAVKCIMTAGRRLLHRDVLRRWMDELIVYVGQFLRTGGIDPICGPGAHMNGMVAAAEERLNYGYVASYEESQFLLGFLHVYEPMICGIFSVVESSMEEALGLFDIQDEPMDLEPHVGDAVMLIDGVKKENKQVIDAMVKWIASLPSTSSGDWSSLINEMQSGIWTADMLKQLSEENETPLPDIHVESKVADRLKSVKDCVLSKYTKLKEHPFMVLFGVVGASALASLFYGFFRIFAKSDEPVPLPMGDMVTIRAVGGQIKNSFVRHPAIKVDDTERELYVRIDKGRFIAESMTTTDTSGSRKDSKKSSSTYDSWYRYNPKKWDERAKNALEAHSIEDPALEDIERICLKNMLAILRVDQDSYRCIGHGIMVTGRVMLTFKHWWGLPDQRFVLRKALTKNNFEFSRDEVLIYPLNNGELAVDAMLVVLPKRFPLARDIVEHFAPEQEVVETHYRARLLSMRKFVDEAIIRICSGNATAKDEVMRYELGGRGSGVWYYVRHHYTHDIDAYKGDCGALLVQANTHKRAKILGLHVAGGHDNLTKSVYNVAVSINQEMLRAGLDRIALIHKMSPDLDIPGVIVDAAALEPQVGGFEVLGVVDKGVTDMKDSCIVASPMYECLGPSTMRPAVLYGSVDGEDVKVSAVKKNLPVDSVGLNREMLLKAILQAAFKFSENRTRQPRLLTLDEAAFGVDGDNYVESLNANSSSGYPWVMKIRKRGKRDFLDLDAKWMSSIMRDACCYRLVRAKQGLRTATLFTDHLKDERRPKKGQKYLKPRLFSGGPLDYTLVFRMYFGQFIAQVMENRIRNTVAVGVNVHDQEWTYLAGELLTKGNNILAGDFSNYDGTLNAEIMWGVLDVIQDWYGGSVEEARVRTVLWCEIVNSVHIFRNAIYQFDHGNPSGNPMTTIINSMYQYIAWCYVVQVEGYRLCDFINKTTLVTYGDDNIMSVVDRFLDPAKMIHGFAQIGMTLTSDDKSSDFGYRKLDEVSFLKRAFAYNSELGRYLAPLPQAVLREMLYWYKKPNNWNEVGPDIVDCCVRELAHHEDATAKLMIEGVLRAASRTGLRVKAQPTVSEMRMSMLEPDYIYCSMF